MLGQVQRRPSQKQRMGGNRERKTARNGGVRGGGVRRSVARTRASTGGYGQKNPTESGWFFKGWWGSRDPTPRPFAEPDGNALALRTWIRRFGRYAGARDQDAAHPAPASSRRSKPSPAARGHQHDREFA